MSDATETDLTLDYDMNEEACVCEFTSRDESGLIKVLAMRLSPYQERGETT